MSASISLLLAAFALPAAAIAVAGLLKRRIERLGWLPAVFGTLLAASTVAALLEQQRAPAPGETALGLDVLLWLVLGLLAAGNGLRYTRLRTRERRAAQGVDRAGPAGGPAERGPALARGRAGDAKGACTPAIVSDTDTAPWYKEIDDGALQWMLPTNAYVGSLRISFAATPDGLDVEAIAEGSFRSWLGWFAFSVTTDRNATSRAAGRVVCSPSGAGCTASGIGNRDTEEDTEFASAAFVAVEGQASPGSIVLRGMGAVAFQGQQAVQAISITGSLNGSSGGTSGTSTTGPGGGSSSGSSTTVGGSVSVQATIVMPAGTDISKLLERTVSYECHQPVAMGGTSMSGHGSEGDLAAGGTPPAPSETPTGVDGDTGVGIAAKSRNTCKVDVTFANMRGNPLRDDFSLRGSLQLSGNPTPQPPVPVSGRFDAGQWNPAEPIVVLENERHPGGCRNGRAVYHYLFAYELSGRDPQGNLLLAQGTVPLTVTCGDMTTYPVTAQLNSRNTIAFDVIVWALCVH